jgi:two-component system nitrate/nitrite response regulator NarL
MDVVICDDHRAFAESLAYVLETEGISVVAVTTSPPEAREAVERHRPDVCIMDVQFPEHDGIEATAEIVARYDSKVLLLTGAGDAHVLSAALAAGASGFVHKAEEIPTIVRAVQRVAKGDVVVETPRLSGTPSGPPSRPPASQKLLDLLTPREREVLELIVRGAGTQEIAERMHVSYSTARTHTQSILTKLGVHSRLEAAAFAVGNRLVLPPEMTSDGGG